jgi:AraC family transcriptional regulator
MKRNEPDNGAPSIAKPLARVLAKGKDWSLSEYICSAGPEDRPFEEQHRQVTIAAVIEGSFVYRADNGTSLLHPGGFLLGNPGRCYECGHDHSRGDCCLALHVEPCYFEEIAASCTSTSYRFPVGMLPATSDLLPEISMLEALTASCELMLIEERVPSLIEAVLRVVSGSHPSSARTSARDERLVSEAFRYIEDHASEALELDGLATRAGMSKYHFLRTFRRTTGACGGPRFESPQPKRRYLPSLSWKVSGTSPRSISDSTKCSASRPMAFEVHGLPGRVNGELPYPWVAENKLRGTLSTLSAS